MYSRISVSALQSRHVDPLSPSKNQWTHPSVTQNAMPRAPHGSDVVPTAARAWFIAALCFASSISPLARVCGWERRRQWPRRSWGEMEVDGGGDESSAATPDPGRGKKRPPSPSTPPTPSDDGEDSDDSWAVNDEEEEEEDQEGTWWVLNRLSEITLFNSRF